MLCCNAQRFGDILARRLPYWFFCLPIERNENGHAVLHQDGLLGMGALRNAKAARNFCLGEAEVFAPCAYGCRFLVDDFVDTTALGRVGDIMSSFN